VQTSKTLRANWLALALCIGTLCACGNDPTDPIDPAKTEFACELGTPDADGAFVPLGPGAQAELVLGFQGFLIITLLVRAQAPAPDLVDITMSVTLEGADPFGNSQLGTAIRSSADGLLTDQIVIFLESSSVSFYQDRTADLALRLEDATRTCTVTGTVLLVDSDRCIHTDEHIVCPEDDAQ
jgi:hypothetical protein